MRTTRRVLLFALLALGTVLVLSCSQPVSISDRLTKFVTSLNGGMADTYSNTDPNAAFYGPAATATFWSAAFPQTRPLAIVTMDTSNPSAVTMQLSSNGTPYTPSYTIVMVNNKDFLADNWLISKITWGAITLFQ